jgi:hypothetical protein
LLYRFFADTKVQILTQLPQEGAKREIARKNAEAEEKFKKKFGSVKPSAGALLHRQRKQETRYFDSGEAFSGVSKKEDSLASADDTQGPLAVVQGMQGVDAGYAGVVVDTADIQRQVLEYLSLGTKISNFQRMALTTCLLPLRTLRRRRNSRRNLAT